MLVQKIITLSVFYLLMSGCFYFTSSLKKAQKALKKENCKLAQQFFILAKNQDKKIEFAKKAINICLIKTPVQAMWFYSYLFKKETSLNKRLFFKEKASFIYFKNLKNYTKAIEGFSFLKQQETLIKKHYLYSFYIALSFFERGKWEASLKELSFFKKPIKKTGYKKVLKEDLIFLKARIFLMQKKYKKAEALFKEIQQLNNVFFTNNQMFFYLSFIYELQKKFSQAITELDAFKNTSSFLVYKIKRLKKRQKQQPREGYVK